MKFSSVLKLNKTTINFHVIDHFKINSIPKKKMTVVSMITSIFYSKSSVALFVFLSLSFLFYLESLTHAIKTLRFNQRACACVKKYFKQLT